MDFLGYIENMKLWERIVILSFMAITVSIVPYLIIDVIKGAGFKFFWRLAPVTGVIGMTKALIVSFFYEKHPVFFHRAFHIVFVALLIFAIYWVIIAIFLSRFLEIVI
jgi:hypothetical protein